MNWGRFSEFAGEEILARPSGKKLYQILENAKTTTTI